MHSAHPGRAKGFTLIELMIVVAIMALLFAMIFPGLEHAKHVTRQLKCAANMRSINQSIVIYAREYDGCYPVEPWEHNPHPGLMQALDSYDPAGLATGLGDAFYCPQAEYMQRKAANATDCPPKGETDSITDTVENRIAGNISYLYWSFLQNKPGWRSPPFFPRKLTMEGRGMEDVTLMATADKKTGKMQAEFVEMAIDAPPEKVWVMTDFFRRKAPAFPHVHNHAGGLNVQFLDGHIDLIMGRPRDSYR